MRIAGKEGNIDLLIIVPPSNFRNTIWPPYGSMYIASVLRERNYNPAILNIDAEHISNSDAIERIERINPKYIGYSGLVATRYKYIKDLSREVKAAFPDKIQILGGALSSAAEVVLNNTPIDVVVDGESVVTVIELLDCLNNKRNLADIKGLYYKEDGSRCVFTGQRPLISNLDILPYPTFDLIDMDKYLPDGLEMVKNFTTKKLDKRIYDTNRKRKVINILTNRGCIGKCSFCVRPDAGLRLHSIKYVFDFMEYCIEKFNVGFISFGDECFAANKARNWEFIEEFKRRKLDVIFRFSGMRVDTVDREILRAYKEIGCWQIEYGFESGSQKMLNIIDKRVTVEQNRTVARWTYEAGIYTSPQLIIAMPGETDGTIQETTDFLKSLNCDDFKQDKYTYALPIPGSPLYEYAKLTGAIQDEDKYLYSLGEVESTQVFHVNLTDQEDKVVAGWMKKIKKELEDHYFYTKYRITNPVVKKIMHLLKLLELYIRRKTLLAGIKRKLKLLFYTAFNMQEKKLITQRKYAQFRKTKNINIEGFLKGLDCSSVNRGMALSKINEKLLKIN